MNAFEVTTCARPVSRTACPSAAGPVVQLSATGSFPAKCIPRNATSAATDAGSNNPKFSPGSARNRSAIVSAPTNNRS